MVHLKLLEKQEANPKISRWKEAIKIRAEVKEMETKRTVERINEELVL
jgi:hypothetical protein